MNTPYEQYLELPEADLYLFGSGQAQRAYLLFGCHKLEQVGDEGEPLIEVLVEDPEEGSEEAAEGTDPAAEAPETASESPDTAAEA